VRAEAAFALGQLGLAAGGDSRGSEAERALQGRLAAALLPPALEWRATRPALGLGRWCALRLADDVAYGTGVWLGCASARSWRAVLPSFSGPIEVATSPTATAPTAAASS
jgi:hypothetical protein